MSYMPPTSGLSLHRTVAERIFPLHETHPLAAIADQVITRFAPLLTSVLCRQDILAEHRLHGANSYGRSEVTAATILREIRVCESLWSAQYDFLQSLDSRLALRLRPLEQSSYLLYLEYLYARLSRSPFTRLSIIDISVIWKPTQRHVEDGFGKTQSTFHHSFSMLC